MSFRQIARPALIGMIALTLTATTATAQGLGIGTREADRPEAETAPKVAKVGEKAPNFTLKDANGREYSLSDFAGKNVVLQWINSECPVCVRVSTDGTVKNMVEELKKVDPKVVHLAIDSTNWHDAENGAKYLKEHEIKAPALSDKDGAVGRMYGARTTPHMFVIDAEGVLRYSGAIDDDRSGRKEDKTNYVVNALTQIKAGETVAPDQTRPYGCSVKYAAGNGEGRGNRGGNRGGKRGGNRGG